MDIRRSSRDLAHDTEVSRTLEDSRILLELVDIKLQSVLEGAVNSIGRIRVTGTPEEIREVESLVNLAVSRYSRRKGGER